MILNSRNTKLANGGEDRGLSDIRIVLCVSIKLMPFSIKTLGIPGAIGKTLFHA